MLKDEGIVQTILKFRKRYGKLRFDELLCMFEKGIGTEGIKKAFGVSRQQVYNWRNLFTQVTYQRIESVVMFDNVLDEYGDIRKSYRNSPFDYQEKLVKFIGETSGKVMMPIHFLQSLLIKNAVGDFIFNSKEWSLKDTDYAFLEKLILELCTIDIEITDTECVLSLKIKPKTKPKTKDDLIAEKEMQEIQKINYDSRKPYRILKEFLKFMSGDETKATSESVTETDFHGLTMSYKTASGKVGTVNIKDPNEVEIKDGKVIIPSIKGIVLEPDNITDVDCEGRIGKLHNFFSDDYQDGVMDIKQENN